MNQSNTDYNIAGSILTENSTNNLGSAILKSTDQGESWNKIYISELPFHIMKVLFADSQIGIAIFQNQEKRDTAIVKRTTDGGKTWSIIIHKGYYDCFKDLKTVEEKIKALVSREATGLRNDIDQWYARIQLCDGVNIPEDPVLDIKLFNLCSTMIRNHKQDMKKFI